MRLIRDTKPLAIRAADGATQKYSAITLTNFLFAFPSLGGALSAMLYLFCATRVMRACFAFGLTKTVIVRNALFAVFERMGDCLHIAIFKLGAA